MPVTGLISKPFLCRPAALNALPPPATHSLPLAAAHLLAVVISRPFWLLFMCLYLQHVQCSGEQACLQCSEQGFIGGSWPAATSMPTSSKLPCSQLLLGLVNLELPAGLQQPASQQTACANCLCWQLALAADCWTVFCLRLRLISGQCIRQQDSHLQASGQLRHAAALDVQPWQ